MLAPRYPGLRQPAGCLAWPWFTLKSSGGNVASLKAALLFPRGGSGASDLLPEPNEALLSLRRAPQPQPFSPAQLFPGRFSEGLRQRDGLLFWPQ